MCYFGVVLGLALANSDIEKFTLPGSVVMETRGKLEQLRDEASADVENLKKSVNDLIDSANETKAELAAQKDAVNIVVRNTAETAKKLEEQRKISEGLFAEIEKQRKSLSELHQLSENTKAEIIHLNELSKDLQLTSAKIVYLQTETKGQFGTDLDVKVTKEIEKELNRLLLLAFPNEKERSVFIANMQNTLK